MNLMLQVTDVKKPLIAVRRITEQGNCVSFGPKRPEVEETGREEEAHGVKRKTEDPSRGDPRVSRTDDEEIEEWFHGGGEMEPNWFVDTVYKGVEPTDMDVSQVKFLKSVWDAVGIRVNQIQASLEGEEGTEEAWDDVHGGDLPGRLVKEPRYK